MGRNCIMKLPGVARSRTHEDPLPGAGATTWADLDRLLSSRVYERRREGALLIEAMTKDAITAKSQLIMSVCAANELMKAPQGNLTACQSASVSEALRKRSFCILVCLAPDDVCHSASVCREFQRLATNDLIWERLFSCICGARPSWIESDGAASIIVSGGVPWHRLFRVVHCRRIGLEVDDVLERLNCNFIGSIVPDRRKGGLIGITGVAIGLAPHGKSLSGHYWHPMLESIVSSLSDSDAGVRYFACEACYNMIKCTKQKKALLYFQHIYAAAPDPDQLSADGSLRSAWEVLDRLMLDIMNAKADTSQGGSFQSHALHANDLAQRIALAQEIQRR